MASKHRRCANCDADCYRKKVWAWCGKQVLCMTCGQTHFFTLDGDVAEKAAARARREAQRIAS